MEIGYWMVISLHISAKWQMIHCSSALYSWWFYPGYGSYYVTPSPGDLLLPPMVTTHIEVNSKCLMQQRRSCSLGINQRGCDRYLGQNHGLCRSLWPQISELHWLNYEFCLVGSIGGTGICISHTVSPLFRLHQYTRGWCCLEWYIVYLHLYSTKAVSHMP